MSDDDLAEWRHSFSYLDEDKRPTDEELRVLEDNYYSPYDDYGAWALVEMYRLGKAHGKAEQ
jgi:hypothetical protein